MVTNADDMFTTTHESELDPMMTYNWPAGMNDLDLGPVPDSNPRIPGWDGQGKSSGPLSFVGYYHMYVVTGS